MKPVHALRYVFLAVLFVSGIPTSCAATGSSVDPYKIFGVDRNASQDEIRARYRKLCLKYHPDKNVGKSEKESKRCTHYFKQIQEANALIGDSESRKSYDWRSKFAPQTSGSSSAGSRFPRHSFNNPDVDAFYRAFASATELNPDYRPRRASSPPFGFDAGRVFSTGSFGKATSMFRNGGSLKSTFVQKVKVPLQDLYKGRFNAEFEIQDNPWKSYSAAFRGGFGYLILYQSLIFAAPALRFSRLLSLILGAVVFHIHVPRPSTLQFTADIRPGYKEGTKIIFRDEGSNFDTMFVLEEEKHDRFKRVGNDLHTSVEILACQAKSGCTVEIESLNPAEPPTLVKIKPNQINQSNNSVVVKGKGWPIRKTGEKGDLVVKFKVVGKVSKRKRKRSKKKQKK